MSFKNFVQNHFGYILDNEKMKKSFFEIEKVKNIINFYFYFKKFISSFVLGGIIRLLDLLIHNLLHM